MTARLCSRRSTTSTRRTTPPCRPWPSATARCTTVSTGPCHVILPRLAAPGGRVIEVCVKREGKKKNFAPSSVRPLMPQRKPGGGLPRQVQSSTQKAPFRDLLQDFPKQPCSEPLRRTVGSEIRTLCRCGKDNAIKSPGIFFWRGGLQQLNTEFHVAKKKKKNGDCHFVLFSSLSPCVLG